MTNEPQPQTETLLPIRVVGDTPTVESLIIADGLGVKHKNLLETIREHQPAIESSFGVIAFETRKLPTSSKVGRPITVAHLTEDQALFIGTLSRNSKQVVEFKTVLVKSFAESRRQLQQEMIPDVLPNAQTLTELISQNQQLLAEQGEMLTQLRNKLITTKGPVQSVPPHRRIGHQLQLPGTPVAAPSLRQLISRRVAEYSEYWQCEPRETWTHLYRRLFEECGFNVHRVSRIGSESMLDVIERCGRLRSLYELVLTELAY